MLGQGSPKSSQRRVSVADSAISRLPRVITGSVVVAALISVLLAGFGFTQDFQRGTNSRFGDRSDVKSVRLRVSWGGGVPHTWQGIVQVTNGQLSNSQSLALNPDSPGGIQLIDGKLSIRQLSATNYGGFDITVEGDDATTLDFKLFPSDRPDESFERKFKLSQWFQGNAPLVTEDIDQQQNQLSIERAPGDKLRVDIGQRHLIFSPGEMMSLGVTPNFTGITSRSANCRLTIVPARKSSPVVWTKSFEFSLDDVGSGRRERMELPMPATEGVYDLSLELEPNWYQVPFNSRKQTVRRKIQLVVVEPQKKKNFDDREFKELLTIDPATGRSLSRSTTASLMQLNRLLSASNARPLGNNRFKPIRDKGEWMGQLEVGGWHAIPLAINKRGMPHIVEIEIPSDSPMAIGTSIIQPDATGQIPSVGFDSGVVVLEGIGTAKPSTNSDGRTLHRLTFWPGSDNPYLLIANRHERLPALIGKIRILHGPEKLPAMEPVSASLENNRDFMAYYEVPLFPENFGASEFFDETVQQPLDDWLTFYTGAERFIQYLKANGYRGAFITVAIDGSSIYPSQFLDPTPKFDSGIFFSNGQDPQRKDVLELLFRMFDREGLKMVPMIAFTSPLPEVEERRHRGMQNNAALVNFKGQIRSESQNGLPVYDPLNEYVQRAVLNAVDELAQRYRDHDSFHGLAISCRPGTYTQLSGLQWGYESSTVAKFKSSIGSTLADPEFIQELIGPRKKEWVRWRAEQMRNWYLQMLDALQQHRGQSKLFLAPSDIYQNEEISSALSPSLHSAVDYDWAMMQLGFDRPLTTAHPDLVLLKPQRIAANQSLASRRVDILTEGLSQAREFFQQSSYRGTLMTSRMSWAHFSEMQEQIGVGNQSSPLIRLQQLSPAGASNRERFAKSLRENDSNVLIDGGILVSNGQEQSHLDFMKVFCRLPNARFQNVNPTGMEDSKSPIAVRQIRLKDRWVFYAVNSSPWSLKCRIDLENSDASGIQSLAESDLELLENQQAIELTLEPYGLVGGVSFIPNSIIDYSVEFPATAKQALSNHLQELQSKLVRANKATPVSVLANPHFDDAGGASLSGWDLGNQPVENVRTENEAGHGDSTSLVIESQGPVVWIRSSPFDVPETGRLSVSVWLRTDDPANQPPLRLALEGRTANTDYYRFGSIGALAPATSAKLVAEGWQRFAVHFDDLPTQGNTELRIGFDLMGPGKVWIDDVEVYDRWFDDNDTKAITQLLATAGLWLSKSENVDHCRRIFAGYWPRFLDEHFPDLDTESIESSTDNSRPESEASQVQRQQPVPTRKRSYRR